MHGSKTRQFSIALLFLTLTLAFNGCENSRFGAREKGALGGAAVGAGLGAIIGNQVGSPGAGVAIGSAIGAVSGGLIGNQIDANQQVLDDREARLKAQERELEENRKIIDELRRRGADVRSSDRGVVVNLPDVLFEFDSARLTTAASRTVREIASVVGGIPDRRISVEGHTDSLGTVAYNQKLSENRARSVAQELSTNGISRRQIVTRGFGESDPISSNQTENGRRRNRRVEVVIENR